MYLCVIGTLEVNNYLVTSIITVVYALIKYFNNLINARNNNIFDNINYRSFNRIIIY